MGRKLIASDYDGTIGDGEQLERDKAAIAAFRKAGNIFGIVSGRNAEALHWTLGEDGLEVDFELADNGGNGTYGGKKIFCYEAAEEAYLPLCDYLMQHKTVLIAANKPDGTDMLYYRHRDGREDFAPRRAQWTARKFTEISAYFGSVEETHAISQEINGLFPHLDALPNGRCLDIIPRGRSKAVGVAELAEKLGIAREDIYSVGDNYNDLAMIDAFNSCVVENAPEELKTHASFAVVKSVEEMIKKIMEQG